MASTAAAVTEITVKEIFRQMESRLNAIKKGENAVIQINLTGENGGNYNVTIKDGAHTIGEGPHASPNTTITMAAQDYVRLFTGKLDLPTAKITGQLKFEGKESHVELVCGPHGAGGGVNG